VNRTRRFAISIFSRWFISGAACFRINASKRSTPSGFSSSTGATFSSEYHDDIMATDSRNCFLEYGMDILGFLFCWAQAVLKRGLSIFPACHAGPGREIIARSQVTSPRLSRNYTRLLLQTAGCGALFLQIGLAQQTQPVSTPQPNCILQAPFTAVAISQVLDNRTVGCLNFIVTVDVPSTVTALALRVETAQDNGSANCGTCTWTTLPPATGSNPNGLIAGWNATFTTPLTVYYDFFRINLTAMTGSGLIYAKLYGSINGGGPGGGGGGGGGGGCPGTTATPCVVVGPDAPGTVPSHNPVLVAGQDSNNTGELEPLLVDDTGAIILAEHPISGFGIFPPMFSGIETSSGSAAAIVTLPANIVSPGTQYNAQYACTLQGTFSASASGDQQIIAASGAKTIRLCDIDFTTTIPENVTIDSGSGVNCGTGTATISALTSIINFDFEWGPSQAKEAPGPAVCINPSVAQAFSVNFTYAQF
jgi:hypothetical protein